MEKDSKIYKGKKERVKSIALKAKKESSDDETLTSGSDDEEYAMAVRNLKSSLEERVNLLGNQNKKRSHSDKGMRRKGRVTGNDLDAVIQIISLAIVQNYLATKIKRHSLEVLVGNKSSSRVNTSKDYALWEVIKNGNSWVPIPVTTPPEETGTSTTTKMTSPATIEEKTCKKNDVKARSLLLMVLPNEHQLTFDQYVDAQSMFAAIKARFGGNESTKKTHKALLKQQYENFSSLVDS
ncbi:hypothetical protein Tco_1110490 [Tanacetum coccineum]|uniref:Uncharacterized protein n=1 Tax=Tanacetum coccineum TaxID=301880 RepID=A0ABQ5ILC9_9ASTR